ncbi:phosphatidylinositol kinase [Sulfurovum sp. bin170]|uniref:HipA N-terminal domain-containing protein n=1 Tax=Sulfurovum sp. bin170 TaxID=2695268 RepID=UPI0013DEA1B1|nr:HipA N-terminal domain-containing protein [Sulfurovum sp. bin170]NEW60064.1 phosphatidylinositol kinase [Sulfurovum sp. bin170]
MLGYVYDDFEFVGTVYFDGENYIFQYDNDFLEDNENSAISLTFPKQKEPFISKYLHPFFSNLLAEGNLKKLQCRQLKIDENDEFSRLLKTANSDTIGAITIREVP